MNKDIDTSLNDTGENKDPHGPEANTESKTERNNGPKTGSIIKTFFRFVIPSVLSLLAISTATVVDGFFVGNYLGSEYLAAINLLMPYFTLLFGIALMLAVGGSVKASICIGKKDYLGASQIFSQIFLFVLLLNVVIAPTAQFFNEELFTSLGATPDLFPIMQDYFQILSISFVVQLCGLVIYYFIRADNRPEMGMNALLLGAVTNIILDIVFIYYLELGIQGAALATLIAQSVQLLFISRYFLLKERNLRFTLPKKNWSALLFSAYNGMSEFINEVSIGVVILVFHWIISRQTGVDGIAAFSAINYIIFISLMVYYGIVDAMHVLLSQNFGAKLTDRVVGFMKLATICIGSLSVLLVVLLHVFEESIVNFFLKEDAEQVKELTGQFIKIIWPIFLFNGFNVLISVYLTSIEKAFHSSLIALSRSLILPIALVFVISSIWSGNAFIYAIPIAEGLTFLLAITLFTLSRPSVATARINSVGELKSA